MEFQVIQYHERCPAVVCMSWLDLTNQAMEPHTRQLVETSIFLASRVQVSHGGDYMQTGFRHMNFHYEYATKHFQLQTLRYTSYMALRQQLSHFLHSFLLTHYALCQNTSTDILSSMISRPYQNCRNILQAGKESLFQSVNSVFIWLHSMTH